jgi:hypothetical protein
MLTSNDTSLDKIDKLSYLFSRNRIIFECLFMRGKLPQKLMCHPIPH